ncbi:MAG: hypothetical protein AAF564_17690 [Bacteroidota bacterium]
MFNFIGQMGTWGPLMVLLTLANLALVARYSIQLFGSNPVKSADINQIMIVAMLVVAIGAFSHYAGLHSGLLIYGQMNPAMFAGGYAVSLVALLFGIAVFIVSTLCWFVLRLRQRRLIQVAA